jgi:hypothetical protein
MADFSLLSPADEAIVVAYVDLQNRLRQRLLQTLQLPATMLVTACSEGAAKAHLLYGLIATRGRQLDEQEKTLTPRKPDCEWF